MTENSQIQERKRKTGRLAGGQEASQGADAGWSGRGSRGDTQDAPSKSKAVATAATRAGRAISKTGMRVAKPLAASIQHEDNGTLAKMVVAAVTPKLINVALRFAIRNPVITIAGVLVVAAMMGSQEDGGAEA